VFDVLFPCFPEPFCKFLPIFRKPLPLSEPPLPALPAFGLFLPPFLSAKLKLLPNVENSSRNST
jgi:hypothetical protein